jgi:hypothetical protein
MRGVVLTGARAALLAGPTVLAFFSGGYFAEGRAWAGLVAWILVAIAIVLQPSAIPRKRASRLAIGGLGLFAVWTLLSIVWAPIAGNAYHAGQIVVLYLGAVLASVLLLRPRGWQRAVEPALAAGALIVVGYGLSGRLLPGVIGLSRSVSAQGRLEQPLTYWNAMGELAALGFVLAARIAGDATRTRAMRAVAAAGCAPLGVGLYLSFSRGALFTCAAGLVVLVAITRSRGQLRSVGLALLAGGVAAAVAAPMRGLTALAGSSGVREREGAIMLGAAAIVMLAAAGAQRWLAQREPSGPPPLRLPRPTPAIAIGVICVGLAIVIVAGAKEKSSHPLSPGATRLATLQSNRYDYWRVAMRAFGKEPLRGVGAGGWAVYWLRYRTIDEFAQDAHSLPLQTLAELGLVGAALLGGFFAGIALAALSAHRIVPALSAGPIAGFIVWTAHSPLDWDWQMPALTLVAMGLAGQLLALSEITAPRRSGALRD